MTSLVSLLSVIAELLFSLLVVWGTIDCSNHVTQYVYMVYLPATFGKY